MPKYDLITSLQLDASKMSDSMRAMINQVQAYAELHSKANEKIKDSFRDVNTMGIGEMRKELMQLNKVSFSGKTPEEILIIKQRMGDLKDTIGDLRSELGVLGGPSIGAVIGGFQFLSAGVEGAVASLSIFGVESEVVQKLEGKITSLIAITQAMGVIEDYVNSGKLTAIGLKIKDTAVTVANTVATKAATIAQAAFATSMKTTLLSMGAVIGTAAVVAGAIYMIVKANQQWSETDENARIQREQTLEIEKEAAKLQADQLVKMQLIKKGLQDKTKTTGEYKEILKELDKELNTNLSKEKDINKAVQEGLLLADTKIKLIGLEAKATAAKNVLIKDTEALLIAQAEYEKADQERKNGGVKANDAAEEAYNNVIEAQKKQNASLALSIQYADEATASLAGLTSTITTLTPIVEKNTKVIDDWLNKIGAVQWEYTNPTMAPLGLPSVPKINLGNDQAGDTVPEFDYDALAQAADEAADNIDRARTAANIASDAFMQMGDALGTAAAGGEVSMKNMVNSILGGVRQVISAKLAEAMAAMIAGESSKGLPGLLLAGIGIAGIQAMFANIPAYETGGIIQGHSFYGDNLLARVNSKEMILNPSQQSRLFALANGGGSLSGGDVVFRIEGDSLVGVLNKHGKKVNNWK